MKTYIKDNNEMVMEVINLMVDSTPIKNEELRKEWKLMILNPYISSLSDLEIIKKYSWIDNTSLLKQHCDFIDKIITICENVKGNDLPSEKFTKHLNDLISDWFNHDLDSILKEEERKFYSRIVWQEEPLENDEKKETPLQKKKAEANIMLKKTKHVNF
jgi:hypothetical protein